MMWLHEQLELEDRNREAEFLESIGPFGRMFDNNLYYCVTILAITSTCLLIGFAIGFLL